MNIGRESETIEFKKSTSELPRGLNSISAILNKHGNGILYFGVNDNGDVRGQIIDSETLRDISREIRNKIKPECMFEVSAKNTAEGLAFIEVVFSGNRSPYSVDGKYYIRFSDEDRQMTNAELENYFRKKIHDYSDWENEDSGVSIERIDQNLLKSKVDKGIENKRIPFAKNNDNKVLLNKLGLLTSDKNNLNNAGNVLFSSDKPVLLKLATFATETKETFIKLDHFQGNIYECIEKGLSYVLETIEWKIDMDGSLQRKEEPEIPSKALREIIMNAFCHGNYNSNTSFEICVFKDKVTIYSPGYFPSGYSPEDFAKRHETPIMLNPSIISVLFKTCEIESFGFGFESTFNICEKNGIDYAYENTKSGFRFTFFRPLYKNSSRTLTNIEKEVLNELKNDKGIKYSELSEKTGKSERTIYRAIKKLKELGYIEKNDNNSDYWKIN